MALYAADGSLNITVIAGGTYTGLYAANGSMNVKISPGGFQVGIYSPEGACYVTVIPSSFTLPLPFNAPDGSMYISQSTGMGQNPAYGSGQGVRVTVVGGTNPFIQPTYYVSALGNDLNVGTIGSPWLTINKVNTSTFAPGTTINFRGGDTFSDKTLYINRTNVPSGGSLTNLVTVQSYGTGQANFQASSNSYGSPYVNGAVAIIDSTNGVVFNNIALNGHAGALTQYSTKDFVTGWTTTNATIVNNAVTAPDSTLTGATFTDNATSSFHESTITIGTLTIGITYTLTVSLKQGTGRYFSVRGGSAGPVGGGYASWATVDTSLGTVAFNANVSSATVTSQTGGWWLLTMTWVAAATEPEAIYIASSNVSTAPSTTTYDGNSYVGTGTVVDIWNLNVTYSSYAYIGIAITNTLGTNVASSMQNITIKNCTLVDFCPSAPTTISGAIVLLGFNDWTSTCGGISNITLLNNTLYASTNVGWGNGVISQSCNGDPINNYNMTGVFAQGNIIYNMNFGFCNQSYGGPWTDPTKNPAANTTQYNLVYNNGAATNTCGGSTGIETYQGQNILHQFNEVYGQTSSAGLTGGACDCGAFDFDINVLYCLGQYNYTHGNQGYSITMNGGGPSSGTGYHTWRYNISENDVNVPLNGANTQGSIAIGNPNQYPCWVYNNTSYMSIASGTASQPSPSLTWGNGGTFPAGYVIANNIFYNNATDPANEVQYVRASAVVVGGLFQDYNIFYNSNSGNPVKAFQTNSAVYATVALWNAGTGVDAHSQIINPGLTTPGSGGTLSWTPSTQSTWPPGGNPAAYKLSSTSSPCIGTGVDLTQSPYLLNVGTRDYFGNTIPHGHGTGYNIGADGGYP